MTEQKFKNLIWKFYREHGPACRDARGAGRRNLPWRKTRDPYKILVSEIMLQQTQVLRVEEKYKEFLGVFPNIKSLAKAPLRDVLRVWQGMGYNRRAKYLKQCAEEIVGQHNGKIPKDHKTLLALPGIGPSTAGGVLAFAYNIPIPYIETNIRRVFIHHFFENKKNISDKKILNLVEKTLDTDNPREWYWALMDYGATLPKLTTNPNRNSKHYTKQSTFKGSNREVRGKILQTLTSQEKTSMARLKKLIPDKRLEENLKILSKEGFIQKVRVSYTLV